MSTQVIERSSRLRSRAAVGRKKEETGSLGSQSSPIWSFGGQTAIGPVRRSLEGEEAAPVYLYPDIHHQREQLRHIGGLAAAKGEKPIGVLLALPCPSTAKCHSVVDKEGSAGISWPQAAGCVPTLKGFQK